MADVEFIEPIEGVSGRRYYQYTAIDGTRLRVLRVEPKNNRHIYITPATPRLNGKVERSHRVDAEEFHRRPEGAVIDDSGLLNERLREWEDLYNFDRSHGSLGGQTPYERLRQKTATPE